MIAAFATASMSFDPVMPHKPWMLKKKIPGKTQECYIMQWTLAVELRAAVGKPILAMFSVRETECKFCCLIYKHCKCIKLGLKETPLPLQMLWSIKTKCECLHLCTDPDPCMWPFQRQGELATQTVRCWIEVDCWNQTWGALFCT